MTINFADTLEEQCEAIWAATRANRDAEYNIRKVPPVVRLWDGEMRLQHLVTAEYGATFELVDGDSGAFEIRHPFDHPAGRWMFDEAGRLQRGEKRNINVTVDYCGSRFGGMTENIELEIDDNGDQIVVAKFLSDYERLKWYSVWSNPWLPEWIQWPQIFIIAGPVTWVLAAMLDFQIQREMGSTWALPSDPMNPASRTSLDQSTWSMVVKPISFGDAMASGVVWSICASRFKNFHDLAKSMYEDGEITPVITVWLEGDPEPWPGANLRHGTRIVSFEDRSGVYTGTSHGGTIFDGLIRTIMEFIGDFIDSSESLATDTTIPPDYYEVGSKRTQKQLPFVVWRDDEQTGLESYRYRHTPSKGIQVVTGGHSMPGVNELISACVAGETIIQGPDGDERIDVLAARGGPFRVWALTPDGHQVAASATRAFLKGQAELSQYVLDDGRSIKTTQQHRFLTRDGWTRAVDVELGTSIATSGSGCPVDQPVREVEDDEYRNLPTTDALEFRDVVQIRPLGTADYYDITVPGLKNYAAQGIWNHNSIQMAGDLIAAMLFVPPIGGAVDAILAPLYCVAGETIIEGPDSDERIDVLAGRGRPFRVWSLSPEGQRVAATARFAFQKGHAELFEYVLANGRTLVATSHHRWLTRTGWLEAGKTRLGTEVASVTHSSVLGPGDASAPLFDLPDAAWSNVGEAPAVQYSPVVSVRSVGEQAFYDMSVPGWVNYSGGGIWSHNTDALLAWMVARSAARANNSGWTRYFEYFQEGSGKAYTISSLMVLRAGIWATRSYDATTFNARDGAPFLIGEGGHVWLGDRAGYTIRNDPRGRIYMDRVSKVNLSWSREDPVEWTITIGNEKALQDPVARAWERIEAIVSSLQQLGVF